MSTTTFPKTLQFKNFPPQTPNLEELKQLRMKKQNNKLKDAIPPTNQPTSKLKKSEVLKRIFNNNKENIHGNQSIKTLTKNQSFQLLQQIQMRQNNNEWKNSTFVINNEISKENRHTSHEAKNKIDKDIIRKKSSENQIENYYLSQTCRHKSIKFHQCYECIQKNTNQILSNPQLDYQHTISIHSPLTNTQLSSKHQNFNLSNTLSTNRMAPLTQTVQQFQNSSLQFRFNTEQEKKTFELQSFKNRSSKFQYQLNGNQKQLVDLLQYHQQRFASNARHIQSTFKQLIQSIEQKQKCLFNQLFTYHQNLKQTIKGELSQIQSIKKSLKRYNDDISKHYQQIIEQLQMQQFVHIIDQYDKKLQYFQMKLQKVSSHNQLTDKSCGWQLSQSRIDFNNDISVHIPLKQLQKHLLRSHITINTNYVQQKYTNIKTHSSNLNSPISRSMVHTGKNKGNYYQDDRE